jgi:hypothetical protein
MKRSFLALSLLALVSAASAQDWFQGTLDQAVAKARNENKLVLIHFDASG